MLIFNCTQAAQDFFTVTRNGDKRCLVLEPPFPTIAEDAQHLNDTQGNAEPPFQWLLHTVTVKRKHCLIAMEINTRFSVTVLAVKKGDAEHFMTYFRALLTSMVSGYAQEIGLWQRNDAAGKEDRILSQLTAPCFFRRSERSVQTQINEVAAMLRDLVEGEPGLIDQPNPESLLTFNRIANAQLRKSRAFPDKDYIVPVEEMLVFCHQQYLNATPPQIADLRQRLVDKNRGKFTSPPPQEAPLADEKPQSVTPSSKPSSQPDLAFLDQMLSKYATADSLENVSTLHGFLTAMVSAPNMLPPSQWLADIWGGEELQPAWQNLEEAQRFIGALFGMMNSISRELMESPQHFGAMFTGSDERPNVADWCFGYICGVGLDEEAWYAMPDPLQDQLDVMDAYAVQAETTPQRLPPRELQQRANQVIEAAIQLHAYWLKQRTPMRMPNVGNPAPRPTQPVVTQKLVGRNDPCPCGSGKKYKKCCLH